MSALVFCEFNTFHLFIGRWLYSQALSILNHKNYQESYLVVADIVDPTHFSIKEPLRTVLDERLMVH